jgi:uncharacterized damage-inducible protein DinB
MLDIDQLRYPIGKFAPQPSYTKEEKKKLIAEIAELPAQLAEAVKHFSKEQFATPYREGGWSVKQLIHHIADSHMHSYIRFKWTLTEEKPVIKAYEEKTWAETIDNQLDPSLSLAFIAAFHAKWSAMLSLLPEEAWQRSFIHPQTQKEINLERMLALYAWHGKHHLAHITSLKERMKWS